MTDVTLGNVRGLQGTPGVKGDDAPKISDIRKTGVRGAVDTYTIFLENGDSYTFTVTNGCNDFYLLCSALIDAFSDDDEE